MSQNNDQTKVPESKVESVEERKVSPRPDEQSGIYLQGHVKIFDPESKEIYFAGRA